VSAVDERTAPAETGTGGRRCSAMIPLELWGAPVLVRCPAPAAGHWAGRCPCGHVRDGWLCEPHAEMAGDGGCRACLELAEGAHDCPLPVSRSTPERSS
jgi:hypothetical protein